ncbi:MAG: hypothetical protein LLG45_13240 [Actinomycetia bacterium]|nr:hypothetical protein [Actinomycetes bacterium]
MQDKIEFDFGPDVEIELDLEAEADMVIDPIITKTIEALSAWYNKGKVEKEEARALLLELRRLIGKTDLHLRMSTKRGCFIIRQYKEYLERDIEALDNFLALNSPEMHGDLFKSVSDFREYLVEFHVFMNGASSGCGEELDSRIASIRKYVEETTAKIDDLLAEQ